MTKRILLFVASFLFPLFASLGQEYTPQMMPNVQKADRREYVSDPASLLDAATKAEVNRRLADLRARTSAEVVVALPPEIGNAEPQEWAEQLFTLWGIGKKDKDNGLLIMISPGSRAAFIQTGYGVEGILPDIACNNIFRNTIVPAMKAGDLAKAVDESTRLVYNAMTDPAVADELRSKQADNFGEDPDSLDDQVFLDFVKWVAIICFLITMAIFIYDVVKIRRLPDNYAKAKAWRSSLTNLLIFGLLGGVVGLIFWLLARRMYKRTRNRPIVCPTCGTKMHKLSEEEDNELLSDSQDLEEALNTVDYDVWECPHCGTVDRFAYHVNQDKYTECPNCHTVAMRLQSTREIRPATTRRSGEGVKIYECAYCHHRKEQKYTIPRKENGAAVAGAVVGSMLGGGRSGGGGFGGGFGGSATGGGGAGGRW